MNRFNGATRDVTKCDPHMGNAVMAMAYIAFLDET